MCYSVSLNIIKFDYFNYTWWHMKGFIDIHSHILPGVDDGSDSYGTSIKMLKCAADNGIAGIILTPHNKPGHRNRDFSRTEVKFKELKDLVSHENINIDLYIGNELYYRNGLLEEIRDGMAGTMAGSHYVLVEFSPLESYDYIRNGLYSLLMGGYSPIAAHVERYQNVCAKGVRIDELIEMGCYIQINAGSIMGSFGAKTRRIARKMLKQHQVHFVATDAHDLGKRAPYLSDCADYISKKYGGDYARKLLCENPLCVIRDEEI